MAVKKKVVDKSNKPVVRKRSRMLFVLMSMVLVLLIVLVVFLLVQLGVLENPFGNLHVRTQEFQIEDECAVIVGNLIHSVQNEDVCEQKCKTECGVRDLFFYDSAFTENTQDCHTCVCYCR